jgi:predicted dehydrogenase
MREPVDRGTVRAGVVGVGTMGHHHARIYRDLSGTTLVGVADADPERADSVAEEFGTRACERDELLDRADVVSIAVPTRYHYEAASAAIDHGTHVLVEKPLVEEPEQGRELIRRASAAGVTLQVGHVERFNPAVKTLSDVIADEAVLAVEAERLGPPLDRDVGVGVVLDLMIHDIDIVRALVDAEVAGVEAQGTADGQYVTAALRFENGTVARLTASRVTQRKVRTLSATTADRRIDVDYGSQSVAVHRQSPTAVADGGTERIERVTEHPSVERGEPLRRQLEAFVGAATTGEPPVVSGEDGLRALELARTVSATAAVRTASEVPR